ncbi:MAG TPA: RidA family protein, partial [Gemmatimonadaceae bacterium]|nr:RidA family protein [Gemmatimonadaceae bacterium]
MRGALPRVVRHPHALAIAGLVSALAVTSTVAAQEQGAAQRPEIEFLTPYGPPTRPFSPAVRVGSLLFLSGQIGVRADAGGALVPGGIKAETRQTLENIRDVLQRVGSSMERVVKCTVMLADMREWEAMNTVYVTFFPGNKPARSALGASG